MGQQINGHTVSVPSVSGKANFPHRVMSAQDVKELLTKTVATTALFKLIQVNFANLNFAAWVWGKKSFALVEVHTSILHGTIASLEWLVSEPGFNCKEQLLPELEKWARERGATKIVTLAYQNITNVALWERVSGWKAMALAIGKDL